MDRVPPLLELCLTYLADNLDGVETFEGIDSALKADLLSRVLKNKDRDSSLANVLKLLDENTPSIDLSEYIFFKDMAFDKLFSKMTSLNTLTIAGHPNLNDFVIENIIRWCPTLKTVVLYKNPRITDRSIALVRAHCPRLETLHTRYCIGVSGLAFCSEVLWRDEPPPTANKNEKNRHSKKLAPIPALPSLPYFTNLTDLDISECKSIVPAKLIPLDRLFPSLKVLAIGKLFLGDEDAEAIIKTAPSSLTTLDIPKYFDHFSRVLHISFNPISSKAILALCAPTRRTQVTNLNFKSCRCILNNSGSGSGSFADILRDMPNLISLDLSQCYQIAEYDFWRLTEDDLRTEFAKYLHYLDLSTCAGITNKTVEHLSGLGLARSLKELRLSGCEQTTDSILNSLPGWFPNLELVDLYGCKSILSESEATSFHAAHPRIQFRTSKSSYMKPKKK